MSQIELSNQYSPNTLVTGQPTMIYYEEVTKLLFGELAKDYALNNIIGTNEEHTITSTMAIHPSENLQQGLI